MVTDAVAFIPDPPSNGVINENASPIPQLVASILVVNTSAFSKEDDIVISNVIPEPVIVGSAPEAVVGTFVYNPIIWL